MVARTDAIFRKLGAYTTLSPQEAAMLEALQGARTFVAAGKELIYEGQHQHAAYILHDGWTCAYKRLRDGARQIVEIEIPGDFIGLRSLLLRNSDQSVVALTNVEISRINTDRLWEAFRLTPKLITTLLWAASRDEAMVTEHLVCVGKRDAMARTAHFLLELGARMELIGLGSPTSYRCPLSQSIVADAVGITAIHLNRVLRHLREAELLLFRDGVVTFVDKDRLAQLTDFDFAYMDHYKPG
ncbi:Crp/Fnr family transcriptional regulator [Mesorhizobium sp. Root157]|nr:Crp/Fnr family transcriptional regulator [Mesorhizobium sp. Root157]